MRRPLRPRGGASTAPDNDSRWGLGSMALVIVTLVVGTAIVIKGVA